MIKVYRKVDSIKAEQFDGTPDSANRMGVEWENGNGFIGDPSYTPESQPGWYIPEDKFIVLGYDENSIKPDDWIVECPGNIRLIMRNNEFKKTYAELPAIPKNVANYLTDCKRAHTTIGTSLSGNIVLFGHARSHDMIHDILSWLCPSDNQDLFARAWLDGYQVEEDK